MAHSELTPVTDPQHLFAPVLHRVVFDHIPERQELADAVSDKLGDRLGDISFGEGNNSLAAEIDGNFLLHLKIVMEPQPEVSFHPVLTQDADILSSAEAVVMVGVLPSNDVIDEVHTYREPRLGQLYALTHATGALAAMDGALAVQNTAGHVTIAPHIFLDGINQELHTHTMIPVWLTEQDDGIAGYTVGMITTGHPELQATGWQGDPSELYYQLSDVANYVLGGASLKDGDTLAFSTEQPPISITETTWMVDKDIPALDIALAQSN